jgi:hypothetical protein
LWFCEICHDLYSGESCTCVGREATEDRGAGIKHDQGKPRMDLIAPELQVALAEILTFGAAKYNDRNWESGMRWGKVFAALMRHLWDWWAKKGPDPETGKSHLWHASCCIMFLVAYESRNIGQDDRP